MPKKTIEKKTIEKKTIEKKTIEKKAKVLPIHIACLKVNKKALKRIVNSVPRRVLEIRDFVGRTPLIITVHRNSVDCATVLLKAGVNVDNTDNAGQTALHIAASLGFHQFVKLLLSYKACWMQRDFFGATALHMAAVNPNVKGLSAIAKHVKRVGIDIQDSTLKTALHWSAAYAYNDNIKVLLSQGANICIPDEEGRTPLHLVIANPEPEALDCVKTLLKKELNLINWQDYEGRSPLHVAVACGSEEVLYFLASRQGCNLDIMDNSFSTPLHWASREGLSEKADILLKKRASHLSIDDINGATPLHYATYFNYAETVKVFTTKNYVTDELDKFGRSSIMWAAIQNAEESLKLLVTKALNLTQCDKNGYNALHAAAIRGHVPSIELLAKAGLPIDSKDKHNMTPFLKACEYGYSKAAQTLLNLGANRDATDNNLCSAMHWCARGGFAFLMQILIHRKFDVNIRDSFRKTPLHYVGTSGDYINCTCVLVESGADPDAVDKDGKTPLHCAVLNERPGIVKYLCEHESNTNPMFLLDDWVTPLDCAMLKGNEEIIKLLEKFGGLRAEDIKEHAAILIQKWFRKKTKIQFSKLKRKSPESALHKDPSYLSTGEDCISVSELPPSFQHSVKNSEIYHMCNGCFHKIICRHVCNKIPLHNSSKERAVIVIQRAWKRFILKKQFAKMRTEVASMYTSNDEKVIGEELWKVELKNFFELLKK